MSTIISEQFRVSTASYLVTLKENSSNSNETKNLILGIKKPILDERFANQNQTINSDYILNQEFDNQNSQISAPNNISHK